MKKLYVIGIGPGGLSQMSLQAAEMIKNSDVIVGYTSYIQLIMPMVKQQRIVQNGMKKEIDRVKEAIQIVENTKEQVSIISSGDAGVYGMAGLALQLCEEKEIEVVVIPGITASSAGASVLGAPLMHDYCHISLSDLLTPYERIQKRVELAAEADFVIALYNPRSKGRSQYLEQMLAIIQKYRSHKTPVGMVKNALRDEQEMYIDTIEFFDCTKVDMRSIVIIGNSSTYIKDGKMITPRGYERKM